MGFPATKSSVSQIIEKLDSLPNSARDTAVNNSIVPSDNLAGLGERPQALQRVKPVRPRGYRRDVRTGLQRTVRQLA